jgi:general secretion pathway protein A
VYLGEHHKEALAILTYGVTERKGFILLTGEIGTGKTTMVKTLISNLDANVKYVYLSNPLLSQSDFIDFLAFSAFRKKVHFRTHTAFRFEFENLLRQCLTYQKNFILIIDEAQNLSFELLEEIEILSEMEFAGERLINIFLVGQIELNEKLRDPRCRAIQQRIKSRYQILPLDLKCTREYLNTRLRIAGATDGNDIFSESAIEAIYHYSEGYPRNINNLADNTLLLGYVRGKRKITAPLVNQCYNEMGLKEAFPKTRQEVSIPHEIRKKEKTHRGRQWKWAAVILLMLAILAAGISKPGRRILWQMTGLEPVSHQVPPDAVERNKVLLRQKIRREEAELPIAEEIGEQISSPIQAEEKAAEPVAIIQPETPKEREPLAREEDKKPLKSVQVREKQICQNVVDLRPVGTGSSFNSSVGRLYCFTRISVSRIPSKVTHVWYCRDTERARVNLAIKSYTWRTYSSKTIRTDDIGEWRVDVLGPKGTVLSTLHFKITQ